MRDFIILLKYLSNPYMNTSKSKKSSVSKNFSKQLLGYAIGSIPLGIFVFVFSKQIFEKLYMVDPAASRLMFLFWVSILSLFFIVGFIGLAMYSLSRNDELEILLTMPISRTTLTVFQIFTATISQIYVLVFFVFVTLAYLIAAKGNILIGIVQLIVHLAFLLLLSSTIAILIGGKTSKSFTRRFYMIIVLLSIFFYFFIIALVDVDVAELQNLVKMFLFSTKEYNILAWSFISTRTLIFSIISAVILFMLFRMISSKIGFEPIQRNSKKRYDIKGSGSVLNAIIKKDLKATIRYEQFLYFVLYPIGFGIFMMFLNKDILSPLMFTIPIFTFYIALETGILMISEISKIEYVSVFPVKFSTLVFSKIAIPVLINIILLLIIFIVSSIFYSLNLLVLLGLLFALLLFTMSSILGAYFAISSSNLKIVNMNRIFSISQTLILEAVTMGLAFGSIIPLGILIQQQSLKWWGWLIMISSLATIVLISILFFGKLKKKMEVRLS